MRQLPHLVYSNDTLELRRREEERTLLAAADLRRYADTIRPHGLHLVLHDSVDIGFDLQPWHLPDGTIDARGDDAIEVALDSLGAVLISGGGIFIGSPIRQDRRWAWLNHPDRTRGELGSSALSGRYLGFVAHGPHPASYTPGSFS